MKMPYPITPTRTNRQILRSIYDSTPGQRLGMRVMWACLITVVLPFVFLHDWRAERQLPMSGRWKLLGFILNLPWFPIVILPCVLGFALGFVMSL